MAKILIIDDEPGIRLGFDAMLRDLGHEPLNASSAEEGHALAEREHPEVVFLDYRLPDRDGLSLLPQLLQIEPTPVVICMTAYGAMDVAVAAMREGAYEYLTKPLDLDEVAGLIERILGSRKAEGIGPKPVATRDHSPTIIGNSAVLQEIYKLIGLLTGNSVTVLITGESGVGKELVARAIHQSGPRAERPFIAVNCGAIPESLIENELFGHEQGAFTGAEACKAGRFELASGGTLFLDEVGELPPATQVKLMRVLQEQCFERLGGTSAITTDARIIAATNRDLKQLVQSGGFRQDLYYRLQMITIHVPPLREHMEDIPQLAAHFLARINEELGSQIGGLDEDALLVLMDYHWPGNVRELENQIKRAAILCRDPFISAHHLDLSPEQGYANTGNDEEDRMSRLAGSAVQALDVLSKAQEKKGAILGEIVGCVEKAVILHAMELCQDNQVHAANLLGISRSTLRKKLDLCR